MHINYKMEVMYAKVDIFQEELLQKKAVGVVQNAILKKFANIPENALFQFQELLILNN